MSPYKILDKYFVYDKIFCLQDYYHDMTILYNELKLLTRDEYENNYRFIFLYNDTDYHISNDTPGIYLRNLQRILYRLDISNFFSLIITQKNIKKDLEKLRVEETNDYCSIAFIQTALEDTFIPQQALTPGIENIERNYLSLNRVKRKHRQMLLAHLIERKLLDKGYVSFGGYSDTKLD